MKNLLLLILLIPAFAFAQDKKIVIDGVSGGQYYILHKTAPKENYYSIGRLYNISPRQDLAPFNGLDIDHSPALSIGQVIKVPLVETNFTQEPETTTEEVFVPVYHRVSPKETLDQISRSYNQVPIARLKSWNKFNDNNINQGALIIIGYLKVKPELSSLAQQAVKVSTNIPSETLVKNESMVEKKPEKIQKEQPKNESKSVTEAVKEPVVQSAPVETKEAPKKEQPKVVTQTEMANPNAVGGGKFKDAFAAQTNSKKGKEKVITAGVFKSTSGWSDGKYYCFNNTAHPGSIIKITNPESNKIIYAKVLDVMPDISQNEGIDLRLSNAGADALGVTGDTFEVKITY